MILLINIGNTHIRITSDTYDEIAKFKTCDMKNSFRVKKIFKNMSSLNIDDIIISSVVPRLDIPMEKAIKKYLKLSPIFVDSNLPLSLNLNEYKNLGADRICVCEAAIKMHLLPAIIFDFGTATTMNIVDESGNFLGGSIFAGISMGLNALNKSTAKLPLEIIDKEPKLIGTNTSECINSGAIYGNATILDGMVKKASKALFLEPYVLLTGGGSTLIKNVIETDVIYNENLLQIGLMSIYEKAMKDKMHK